MVRAEKVNEYLRYEFTEKEQTENAKTLARKNRMLAAVDLAEPEPAPEPVKRWSLSAFVGMVWRAFVEDMKFWEMR